MHGDLPLWSFPLSQPPEIVYTGIGRHGLGETSKRYVRHDQWCLHFYRYKGLLELGEIGYEVEDGAVSLIPPETPFRHVWRRPGSVHFFSLFRCKSHGKTVLMPLLSYPDNVFLYGRLEESVAYMFSHPEKASARLWDALWTLAVPDRIGNERPAEKSTMPVEEICREIERSLAQPLRVEAMARRAGLSHNQFTRRFSQHYGMTVIDYIQERRWERAQYLLQATSLSIKVIAMEVGMPDLGHFNKFIHSKAGISPRELREHLQSGQT